MDELLTAQDVAKILKVSPSAVFKWAKKGAIRSTRLGKKSLRFKPPDVEEFVERGERGEPIHKNGETPVKALSSSP